MKRRWGNRGEAKGGDWVRKCKEGDGGEVVEKKWSIC